MVDFASVASVSVDDLPTVRKLPIGSYIWSVDRLPEQKESQSGNGINVNFLLRCVGPVDPFDGDLDELDAFEGGVEGATRTKGFFIPSTRPDDMEESKFKDWEARAVQDLRRFLQDHLEVEGSSLNEMMTNCLGHQCIGTVAHEPLDRRNPNGDTRDAISRTAPLLK